MVLDTAEPLTVVSEGLDLVGYAWGAGRVVALAHGWSSRAGHLATFVEPLVGAGHRVVSVDMPGHGASPGRLSNLYRFSRALRALAVRTDGLSAVICRPCGSAVVCSSRRPGCSPCWVSSSRRLLRCEGSRSGRTRLQARKDLELRC